MLAILIIIMTLLVISLIMQASDSVLIRQLSKTLSLVREPFKLLDVSSPAPIAMPVTVPHPHEPTALQLERIKEEVLDDIAQSSQDFGVLEKLVNHHE